LPRAQDILFPKNVTLTSPEEVERMKALCKQVVDEKDLVKFSALLEELDALLRTTEDRLKREPTA
jgi:hypothetical protein